MSLEKRRGMTIFLANVANSFGFFVCSKCGFLKQMLVKKTSIVEPRPITTFKLGIDTYQYTHRQSSKKESSQKYSIYVYSNEKAGVHKLEKRRDAYVANSSGFNCVLSVVSSSKIWTKNIVRRTRIKQDVYYEGARDPKYHLNTKDQKTSIATSQC